MQAILELIESEDILSLLFLIAVLFGLGTNIIDRQPQLRQWGLRIATAVLLGYCLYAGSGLDYHSPEAWLAIVWRAILAAVLALGISWIVLGVLGFLKGASDRATSQSAARRSERQRKRKRQREEKERQRQQEAWERDAPERERQQQLEDAREQEEQRTKAAAQQQRDNIRYACELYYNLHAPMIDHRFSKGDLASFLTSYMGDSQTVDVVRQRCSQLTKTIQQHVEVVTPREAITSLEGLATWFTEQKRQIDSLPLDGMYKQDFLVTLNDRYGELTQQLMEDLSP